MAKNVYRTQKPLCITLDKGLTQDLKVYSEITGKAVSRVIAECLEQRLMPLRNRESGTIKPLYGQLRLNPTEAPQMCYVLNETMVNGEPYYTVYFDGSIRNVPREQVDIEYDRLILPVEKDMAEGAGEE